MDLHWSISFNVGYAVLLAVILTRNSAKTRFMLIELMNKDSNIGN